MSKTSARVGAERGVAGLNVDDARVVVGVDLREDAGRRVESDLGRDRHLVAVDHEL